jgi:sugar fermentation stimulation protein A
MLGLFLERPNRFVARVRLEDGSERLVHIASSGRMTELLVPGAQVAIRLTESEQPGRKTAGLLTMVRHHGFWVSVDTAMPGKILRKALAAGEFPPFAGYTDVRPEFTYGDSRIDFRLAVADGLLPPCLLEVKSVTSVRSDPDGTPVARFPDAPTERGAKHLRELVKAAHDGYRAAVCFIIQRDDALAFGPWDAIDPAFGTALRAAADQGVEVHAWRTTVSPERIALDRAVPLRF